MHFAWQNACFFTFFSFPGLFANLAEPNLQILRVSVRSDGSVRTYGAVRFSAAGARGGADDVWGRGGPAAGGLTAAASGATRPPALTSARPGRAPARHRKRCRASGGERSERSLGTSDRERSEHFFEL